MTICNVLRLSQPVPKLRHFRDLIRTAFIARSKIFSEFTGLYLVHAVVTATTGMTSGIPRSTYSTNGRCVCHHTRSDISVSRRTTVYGLVARS